MSWLGKLVGETAAQPIDAIGNVFDKLFTSDEERSQAEAVLAKIRQRPDILQGEINKIEAQHRSVFVAGWRPFIGWVCGSAMAYSFVFRDMGAWALRVWWPEVEPPPELAMEHLMAVVGSLLGLGSLRTAEKMKGRAK